MTSSNGNIFHITGLCKGNSPVTGEFPSQRPVTRSFDVVVVLHMPGLARWLTLGRSSCGSTLYLLSFFSYLFFFSASSASSFFFFLCFLFLLLLLLLGVGCHFWQEVGCLFRQDFFFRVVVILHACVRVAVADFFFVVSHWPNQGWESTHRLHL